MAENQNVEWKESWRDEYLKWICGFADARTTGFMSVRISKLDLGGGVGVVCGAIKR